MIPPGPPGQRAGNKSLTCRPGNILPLENVTFSQCFRVLPEQLSQLQPQPQLPRPALRILLITKARAATTTTTTIAVSIFYLHKVLQAFPVPPDFGRTGVFRPTVQSDVVPSFPSQRDLRQDYCQFSIPPAQVLLQREL